MPNRKPRRLSLVKFQSPGKNWVKAYPFKPSRVYVFLGELANMRGHCVVADHKTGRIYSGYHTENFAEITEDD